MKLEKQVDIQKTRVAVASNEYIIYFDHMIEIKYWYKLLSTVFVKKKMEKILIKMVGILKAHLFSLGTVLYFDI